MWNYNFYVYITTNPGRTTLYCGVTNNLNIRVAQHYENRGNKATFAGKYHCYLLVYFEHFSDIRCAIDRETEIKTWSRAKNNKLIESTNPEWKFLNKDIEN